MLSDEIYARIIYGGNYHSMMSYPGMEERTLIIDGFSKSFAMTGWRLGYAVAPARIVPALEMLAINTYTCTAEFTQYAAIEALRDREGATPRMVAEFAKRRDQFVRDLNRVPGFRCPPPEGAFYAWVNISKQDCPPKKSAASCWKRREWPRFRARLLGRLAPSLCDFHLHRRLRF